MTQSDFDAKAGVRNRPDAATPALFADPPRPAAGGRPASLPPALDQSGKDTEGLGVLSDAEPDSMVLHTTEAYRLFLGRKADAEGQLAVIVGGRRFAAVLKSIWHLSAHDNPYADWILIRVDASMAALRGDLNRAAREREEDLARLAQRGLNIRVMGARHPLRVELGFRSPYGYATADLIVGFDYYVRLVKTLMHKDRLTDAQGRAAIRALGRPLRALFQAPIRWERLLLREELRPLSRADFLPGADEAGQRRARAVAALLGEVPRDVLAGTQTPRHTRRRAQGELRSTAQASRRVEDGAVPSGDDLL